MPVLKRNRTGNYFCGQCALRQLFYADIDSTQFDLLVVDLLRRGMAAGPTSAFEGNLFDSVAPSACADLSLGAAAELDRLPAKSTNPDGCQRESMLGELAGAPAPA